MKYIKRKIESLAYAPDNHNYLSRHATYFEQDYRVDKKNLNTWVLPEKGDLKAVVIHFHGSGYNLSKHISHIEWLSDFGIRTYSIDYPGYGKSEGTPSRKSVQDSSRFILKEVSKNHQNDKIFVFGQSLGGAICLEAMNREPDFNPAGVILDSTFASYKDVAYLKLIKRKYPHFIAQILVHYLDSLHDPICNIEPSRYKSLIVHSDSDPVVPLKYVTELIKLDARIESWIVSGRGHTDVFRPDYQEYRSKMIRWMIGV